MSDWDFTLAILDLMSQENNWRSFLIKEHAKVQKLDTKGLQIDSIFLTSSISNEDWHHHQNDANSSFHIFTAHHDALKCFTTQKQPHPADIVATSFISTKHAHGPNSDKAHLHCSNPHCGPKIGHNTVDCITYKGAKQGQYSNWW